MGRKYIGAVPVPSQESTIGLPKCPTGIQGLDEVTEGGLPRGRSTLVCGSAGSGKTLLAMEFIVRGAVDYNEPGVFMSFEETAQDLTANVAPLGFDLDRLAKKKKIFIDHVQIDRSHIEETGEYDLEALFIRLSDAIDTTGAKRVVLDSVEALFSGLSNMAILRSELRRLFQWLKDKAVTAVITGEQGDGSLTRHGLEEYISDCVILLDHRVTDQMSTRRLRIVKYRGSAHGTNEFPFLVGKHGISVLPITSVALEHTVSSERISTGIKRLDTMLGSKGFYRGTTMLVSGTGGTGKSSLAVHFVDATCRRGERCLYFALEESASQIIRNMRSIGIDLDRWKKKGLLQFYCSRPTTHGLETLLLQMHDLISQFEPQVVIMDPASAFTLVGNPTEINLMLTRFLDFLKARKVTTLLTTLTSGAMPLAATESGISSIVDTCLMLREIESNGERNRGIYILKSRGMAHSNQIHEFLITDRGIDVLDVYTGSAGVLSGTARLTQEAKDKAENRSRELEIQRKRRELKRRRKELDENIESLKRRFEAETEQLESLLEEEASRSRILTDDRRQMGRMRRADVLSPARKDVRSQKSPGN